MIELKKISEQFTQKFIIYGLVIILVLMPFHAFLAISLGSLGIDRTLVQSWKEILILIMSFIWVIYQISKKKLAFKTDAINLLFLSIIFLSILVSAFIRPGSEALLFGIKTNLVALALFFIAQIPISNKSFLKRNLLWLIIIPGVVVSLLAFFQAFLITPETLEKIGYTAATINPRQIIDGSINFLRSFSTLGGPNQLGAYLLIPLAFSLVYGIRQKKWFVLLPSMLILAAIVLSFSRSAWIGAIITFSLSVFLSISKKQKIYFLIISLLVAFIVGGTIASQIGTNERLQNVLLHGRVFEGRIEGSDQGRLESIARIAGEVTARPFGHGLGSAGPASFRSENPIIPENWFLQIGYEIGIAGLLLYIFAFAALLGEFIRNRSNNLAITLFSITAGVLVINIFLQAWADSTLALMMFALYGIYRSNNK
jgi:O-antigen ligase